MARSTQSVLRGAVLLSKDQVERRINDLVRTKNCWGAVLSSNGEGMGGGKREVYKKGEDKRVECGEVVAEVESKRKKIIMYIL